MRSQALTVLLLTAFSCISAPAAASDLVLGGDRYAAGSSVEVSASSARDLFAAGFSVDANGNVTGDLHAAGFDVDIEAPVGGDLLAVGFSVDVGAPVAEDLTVSAGGVDLSEAATVGGNARIWAGSATIDGAIAGSLLAAGGSIELNGTVAGDANLTAGDISFGSEARIGGTLTYASEEPIEIPEQVVPAERVRFEKLERSWTPEIPAARDMMPPFMVMIGGFVLALAFLVIVGIIAYALAPATIEKLRRDALDRPLLSILLGALGLSMLFGLVPVSAMTIVGIPLVPLVVLAILLAWLAGYLVGVYVLSWRVFSGIASEPQTGVARLGVLVLGLITFALLNFVPFVGWAINLVAVFLGLGAFMKWGARSVSGSRATEASVAHV